MYTVTCKQHRSSPSSCARHCCSFPQLSEIKDLSFLDLSGNKLTLDDLGHVLEEVLDVAAHWYTLGLQLQVRISMLDSIRIQFQNPRDQLLEVLKTWLTTSDNTSWKGLTDALRSRSVGASQLADGLERKHCVMEEIVVDSGTFENQPETNVLPPSTVPEQVLPTPQPLMVDTQEGRYVVKGTLLNTHFKTLRYMNFPFLQVLSLSLVTPLLLKRHLTHIH